MFQRSRRIVSTSVITMCFLALVHCGDSGTGPGGSDDESELIDQGIQALGHLEQIAPFDERPAGDPVEATYSLDGRTYACTEQAFEVGARFDENIALNPTSDILWPGSIIDGATVPTGAYVPIIAPRAPITISVSLINIAGAKSRTVQDPKLSTMREAMADLLTQEVTGATDARVTFEIIDVYSASQLDIALGATYSNGAATVKGQFDFSRTDVLSRTIVKFMQVYYTIDVDIPERPSDLFDPSVTWASVQSKISSYVAPMYISSISYGRMALFTIESSYSATEVHAALEASAAAIDAGGTLDAGYSNVLQQSSMKGMIIGGSGAQAVQAVNGFDGLRQYMTTGGNYDQNTAAAPLAYKLRYLSDNVAAEVVRSQSYVVKTCEEMKPGRYGMKNEGGFVAKFWVYYEVDGQQVTKNSGNLGSLGNWATDVPANATNVWVRGEYLNVFTWNNIFRYPGSGTTSKPEVKCWKVTGFVTAGYAEITCDF